ncbi:PP2C family serine/threonine-protein phosphatase [Kytococcus sp. Marseille-QA3725]
MGIDPRMLATASPEVGPGTGAPLEPGEMIRWAAHTEITCQDAAGYRPYYYAGERAGAAALSDGAGVGPELRPGCEHEVDWFSEQLVTAVLDRLVPRDALGPVVGQPPSLREVVADALDTVSGAHPQCDADRGPWATLAVTRALGDRLEYFVLSDSSLVVRFTDGQVLQVLDGRLDELTGGWSGQEPSPAQRMNRRDGWWSARADARAATEGLVGSFDLDDVEAAWLASDGATRPIEMFGTHDAVTWTEAVERDPWALAHGIRTHETEQAEELRERGSKVHDDIAILRVV